MLRKRYVVMVRDEAGRLFELNGVRHRRYEKAFDRALAANKMFSGGTLRAFVKALP